MAVFGFNNMREKIEVLPKNQTYTREEVCTNSTGRPIILFGGKIELWIWKHVSLGSMPANGHLDIIVPLGDFSSNLPIATNPNNFCTVFITPISESGFARDITVVNRDFAISGEGSKYNVLRLAGYNHTSQAANLLADMLIIKQVP